MCRYEVNKTSPYPLVEGVGGGLIYFVRQAIPITVYSK